MDTFSNAAQLDDRIHDPNMGRLCDSALTDLHARREESPDSEVRR